MQSDADFPYAILTTNKGSTINRQRLKIKIDHKSRRRHSSTIPRQINEKHLNHFYDTESNSSLVQNPENKFDVKNKYEEQRSTQHIRRSNHKLKSNHRAKSNSVGHIHRKITNGNINSDNSDFIQENEVNQSNLNSYIDEIEYIIYKMKRNQKRQLSLSNHVPTTQINYKSDFNDYSNIQLKQTAPSTSQTTPNANNFFNESGVSINSDVKLIKEMINKPIENPNLRFQLRLLENDDQKPTKKHSKRHHFLNRNSSVEPRRRKDFDDYSDDSFQPPVISYQPRKKLVILHRTLSNLQSHLSNIHELLDDRQKEEEQNYLFLKRSNCSQNQDELSTFYFHLNRSQEHLNQSEKFLINSQNKLNRINFHSTKYDQKKLKNSLNESQLILSDALSNLGISYVNLNELHDISI